MTPEPVVKRGPEPIVKTVQDQYEKTLEEADKLLLEQSASEQLARHLSRGLRIRRSAEQRVIRSPSARKIGAVRRRSRESPLANNESVITPALFKIVTTLNLPICVGRIQAPHKKSVNVGHPKKP